MTSRLSLVLVAGLALAAAAGAGVLVYDHDNGQTFNDPGGRGKVGTEYAVKKALEENGVFDYEISRTLPADLSGYDAVFVLCGFWPHDGRLPLSVQNTLKGYLDGGGDLYVEGTDVAMRYGATPLFAAMGVAFADDGRRQVDGNVNVLETLGDWAGLKFDYYSYQKDKPDAYVDELMPAGGDVMVRSTRAGNRSNGRVVRFTSSSKPFYRVVVSTFIFGAVKSGQYQRSDLMAKYLEFLGLKRAVGKNMAVVPVSFGRVRAMFRR
jgi:hypothetical protein